MQEGLSCLIYCTCSHCVDRRWATSTGRPCLTCGAGAEWWRRCWRTGAERSSTTPTGTMWVIDQIHVLKTSIRNLTAAHRAVKCCLGDDPGYWDWAWGLSSLMSQLDCEGKICAVMTADTTVQEQCVIFFFKKKKDIWSIWSQAVMSSNPSVSNLSVLGQ